MAGTGKIVALIKALAPGVDPSVIEQAVTDWLDDHPEATTTVEDGSITEEKLASDVLADLAEIEELKEAIVPLTPVATSGDVGKFLRVKTVSGGKATAYEFGKEIYVTPQMFGAVADGVTDDSDAINAAISAGKIIYFPAGTYGITETIVIGSNKILFGDGDSSVIKLIDDGSHLTSHVWYPDEPSYPSYYPYITTSENAHDIKISRIRVEGNTTTASANLHVGIALETAENVTIEDCSVWKVNYHLENAPERPSGQWRTGWNIGVLRSENVEIARCISQYGAYECMRIGPWSENIYVHDCIIEYGWRTGLQVVRGCNNITAERLTIVQDDFDTYDTTACITLHPSESDPINNVLIKDCYVEGTLWGANGDGYSHNLYQVDKYCYNVVVDGGTWIGKGTVESVIMGFRQLTVRNAIIDCTEGSSNSSGIGHSATVSAAADDSHLIVENCKIFAKNLGIDVWGGYQKNIVIRGNYVKTTVSHAIYFTPTAPEMVIIEGNQVYAPAGKDCIIIITTAGMDGGVINGNVFLHGRCGVGGGASGNVVNTVITGNSIKKTTSGINSNISNITSNVIANNA